MKYQIDNDLIFVSLNPDDPIMKSLLGISIKLNLESGYISGIGAINNVLIGMYDINKKKYNKKEFKNDYELICFLGNISLKENKSFIHAHVSFSNNEYKVFGGHLFEGIISATGEFIIRTSNLSIKRKINHSVGLPLWCLGE